MQVVTRTGRVRATASFEFGDKFSVSLFQIAKGHDALDPMLGGGSRISASAAVSKEKRQTPDGASTQ